MIISSELTLSNVESRIANSSIGPKAEPASKPCACHNASCTYSIQSNKSTSSHVVHEISVTSAKPALRCKTCITLQNLH